MKEIKKVIGSLFLTMGLATGLSFSAVGEGASVVFNKTNNPYNPTAICPANTTISLNAVYERSTTIGGVSVPNTEMKSVEFKENVVIKPYSDKTTADLWLGLLVTNGTLTLDLTDVTGKTFVMQGGLIVDGAGSFVVKGRDQLLFGRNPENFPGRAAGWDCPSVTFVDAEGVPYPNPKGVVFTNMFLDVRLPENVPWAVAKGATAMITTEGTTRLVSRYVENGILTLEEFDVWMLNEECAPGISFKVMPGRDFAVFPRGLSHDAQNLFNFNGRNGKTFPHNVELCGEGALFSTRNHYSTIHTGTITGMGTILHTLGAKSGAATYQTTMKGSVTFSGNVISECTAKDPLGKLVFEQASIGAAGNTLSIGDGMTVVLKPSQPSSGSIASISGPSLAKLVLGDGTELSVAGSLGAVVVEPESMRGAKLIKTALAEDEFFGGYTPSLLITYSGNQSGVRSILGTNGEGGYYRMKSGNPTVDLEKFALTGSGMELKIVTQDGDVIKNASDVFRVSVPANATVTVIPVEGASPLIDVAEGGKAVVKNPIFDFEDVASFWLDADDADSYTPYVYDGVARKKDGNALIDIWNDCRGTHPELIFRSDKFNNEQKAGSSGESVMPIAVAGGLNGRTYMAMMPDNRRIAAMTKEWSDYCLKENQWWNSSYSNFKPEFCIMVFGSQDKGGGCAVLADNQTKGSGYFIRGGDGAGTNKGNVTKDNPVFKNDIPVWIDGERVPATTTGLSGGWQILAFPTYGKTITGLGFSGTSSSIDYLCAGNANYAEVLFFDRELADWERTYVERYLANKWGLTYKGPAMSAVKVRAVGKGTVELGANAELAPGDFAGVLALNGKSISVSADPLPPTDPKVVTDGVAPDRWFDPDLTDENHMTLSGMVGEYGRYLHEFFDVRDGKQEGKPFLAGAGRSPILLNASGRGGSGPVHNWIDFSPTLTGKAKASGLCLRFQNYPSSGTGIAPLSARTVIMVQDSSKGGGTPFMDTVAGSTLLPRYHKYAEKQEEPDPGRAIWRDTTANVFAGGATYLDGVAVDGAFAGFNGRPEVLTAVGGANFNLGDFGDCQYLEGHEPNDIDAGEVIGEIVIYGEVLSDAQRKAVEAYLSWKWCGRAINGYAVHANTTITGNGTVTVASLDQMPKFAAGFTGTADLSAISELAFTIDPKSGTIDGAISNTGTLVFPAAVTAKVAFSSRMKAGKYALVTAAGGLDQTGWTLDFGGTPIPDNVKLNVSATKVELEVQPLGMLMLVR